MGQFVTKQRRVARPDVRKGVAQGYSTLIRLSRVRHAHPDGLGVPPNDFRPPHDLWMTRDVNNRRVPVASLSGKRTALAAVVGCFVQSLVMLCTNCPTVCSHHDADCIRSLLRSAIVVCTIASVGCDTQPQTLPRPSSTPTATRFEGETLNAGKVKAPTEASQPSSGIGEGATIETADAPDSETVSARSYRPPDLRLRHDAERLNELGIHEYVSRRLILYTDIEPDLASILPPVIDRAFEAWEAYFGPLPPARDGSDYQLTGYLMRNQAPFRTAGLLPVQLAAFAHGKHDGQQFWMNDSDFDYYRRHLMIHEATHCFMQSMGGTTRDVPVWYLEGMAELFATHAIADDGTISFGVMPDLKENFIGFGRIPMIQRAIADGHSLTLDQVSRLQPKDFVESNESYAWSWTVCQLAATHPRYRDTFRQLGREYVEDGFQHTFAHLFDPLLADFDPEWTLFVRHLCYGYDIERAVMLFQPGIEIEQPDGQLTATVLATRGWQSSAMAVHSDQSYVITATGRTAVAQSPRPWESEPQGISIRWNEGTPIGRLLGIVISEPDQQTGYRRVSPVLDIGEKAEFTPPFNGTLYLRVNDFWNELNDNSGEYAVSLHAKSDEN